ncbi:DUF393 domain-containing protein [Primorskyibacter aestuariivivens]|uniref:thiol-disulfide oxidoreductase DCC family protein n=1 Tax=Primorskyibacter aestuariivivens TaxID=1888912 RepID=UPI0022FFD567|nr:DUF393 domain-containing protein [Primorskyibacter aestuariivivens]MDA7429498.1 DUF393 domain-containing protein [Primorskyibacter aestuariivivens]
MSEHLTVIYNDTCPICAREVNAYRDRTDPQAVRYHGVSQGQLAQFDLTEDEAARRFHVIRAGERLEGVDAFAALWARIPRLRWLGWMVMRPGIHGLAMLVYNRILAPLLYGVHRRRVRRLQKRVSKLG